MESYADNDLQGAGSVDNVTGKEAVEAKAVGTMVKSTDSDTDVRESNGFHDSESALLTQIAHKGKVRVIREHDPNYVVYIDKRENFRWLFSDKVNVDDKVSQRVMLEVRHAAATPAKYLGEEHYDSWVKMLAHSISLLADGQPDYALEIVGRANRFIEKRAQEKARMWMVESSVVTSIPIFLLCIMVLMLGKENISISLLLAAMAFGVIGSQFSVLARLGDMNVDPAAGRGVYWKDASIRIVTGMFAAIIAYVALKSEVVFGFIDINELGNVAGADMTLPGKPEDASVGLSILLGYKDFWVMAIMATLAGFSERFIPSFLGKMEEKTLENAEREIAGSGKNAAVGGASAIKEQA